MTIRIKRRNDLLDQLNANPTGITVDDMMATHGWDLRKANTAISDVRRYLGKNDVMNLVCEPQGQYARWLYRLVGTLDEAEPWTKNRTEDVESRLRTMNAVMSSVVRSTNGRTKEGKRARMLETGLRHLVENLDNLVLYDAP